MTLAPMALAILALSLSMIPLASPSPDGACTSASDPSCQPSEQAIRDIHAREAERLAGVPSSPEMLYSSFVEDHNHIVSEALRTGTLPRVILCQPLYGLANRMRAMMTCLVTAMATKRALFIDWEGAYKNQGDSEILDMPGGQPASLEQLFLPPDFDWSIAALERIASPDVLREMVVDLRRETTLRDTWFACGSEEIDAHPVLALATYFWWDLVLHNPFVETTFEHHLGRDDMGIIRAWEKLGPLFFRPVPEVAAMRDALTSLFLPKRFAMGIHIRMGGNWYDQADKHPRSNEFPVQTATCAVAVLPPEHRALPVTYLIISDSAQAKTMARYVISTAEVTEVRRYDLSKAEDPEAELALDALGVADPQLRGLLKLLGAKVYDYETGSRVVVVGPGDAARQSARDVQQALAEVLALGETDSLVRTAGSSFVTAAYALRPKRVFYISEADLACHLQASSEPMMLHQTSAVLNTALKLVSCFNMKRMLTFTWAKTGGA